MPFKKITPRMKKKKNSKSLTPRKCAGGQQESTEDAIEPRGRANRHRWKGSGRKEQKQQLPA